MTAATDSAIAATGGWGLSQDGPEAAHAAPPEGRSVTAARPVPAVPAATSAILAQTGRTVVPAPRSMAGIRHAVADSATTSRTAGNRLSPQVTPPALAGGRDSSDQGAPGSATPVGGGPELSAVAYVDGLDGSERKLLMHHIAQAFPDVVEAGAELVAQWRAECAEHRRQRLRRNEHDRRARQRRQAGDGG